MSAYLDKINPFLSERGHDELTGFVKVKGAEACLREIDEAMDRKNANWHYIRGIPETKQSQGVRCLADWDEVEHKRRKSSRNRSRGNTPPVVWRVAYERA